MRLAGRLWFKDTCSGIEWQHRLVPHSVLLTLSGGQDCYAISIEAHRCVYYYEDAHMTELKASYCHETHHRPSMAPGQSHALEKIYGATGDTYVEREEDAATYYGSIYSQTMGKFLKLPRIPRKKAKT